jgi:organic hydroperoxide reductase OsmC/OhrA
MHPFPHHYPVAATASFDSEVSLTAPGVPVIKSAGPVEFGGPGDLWSPESLLVASVADCFVLSFRAIARVAKFDWVNLDCQVNGTLDRVDGQSRFTDFVVKARLTIPKGADVAKAEKLLHKAERGCLITNSLYAESHLELEVAEAD